MNLIAAVDQNWGIGHQNKLLVSIPEDQKFFREKTTGKVVVMGRKTMESFPGGSPLKNRTNIVLTRNPGYRKEGAFVLYSVEDVLDLLKQYPSKDVFVIGGDSIYRQFLPYCDKAYITKIDKAFDADAYFPNLDEDPAWELTHQSEEGTYFNMEYVFTVYTRKSETA